MAEDGGGLEVLVTGAHGFVGSVLVPAVAARWPGWRVVAPPAPGVDAPGTPLDLVDAEAVDACVREHLPDVVIHLAAVAAVTSSDRDPRLAWRVNLEGTLNLVLALRRHAPDAHLLHMSTGEVYGASAAGGAPLTEDALLQPLNPYAASKAAADILVRQAMVDGLSATIMRPFNQVGPGQSESFALPSFAAQIARIEAGRQPPVLWVGALDEARDVLDVRDAADAYLLALERRADAAGGEVFNVCSGATRRIGDLLEVLTAMSRVPIEVRVDPSRLRRSPSPVMRGDNRHLRETLGWAPTRPVESALEALLAEQRRRV